MPPSAKVTAVKKTENGEPVVVFVLKVGSITAEYSTYWSARHEESAFLKRLLDLEDDSKEVLTEVEGTDERNSRGYLFGTSEGWIILWDDNGKNRADVYDPSYDAETEFNNLEQGGITP